MPDFLHPDIMALVTLVGYPGLFTAIFLESGVFFGFFLPGGSLLFTAGVLAGAGVFNVWIVIPLVTIAAILGDNVGYWFGAKMGHALFTREDSRFFKHKHVERTHAFFEKYGARTIVIGRFIPIVRTFAPILAGVGEMKYSLFFRYNILGALLWASGVSLAGYFLSRSIPNADRYITPIIAAIIIASCIPLAVEWYKHRKQTSDQS